MEHADGDQGRPGGDISEEGDPMNAGPVGRDAAGRAGLFECALVGSGTLLIRCAELLLRNGHAIRRVVSDDMGVRRWAAQQGIVHGDDVAGLAEQPFDYLFSILNGLVLAPDVLRWPRRAAINYHDAPLPRYGGMHVTSWALINRETSYAVTWHLMAERVDAGAILKQRPVAIALRDTALTLNAACYQAAFAAFGELQAELEAGTAVARAEVETPVTGGVVHSINTFTSLGWDGPQVSRGALRFLDVEAVSSFLSSAGLEIEEQFGDWTRQLLTDASPEIITIARRG